MWENEIFNFLDGRGGAVCEKKKREFDPLNLFKITNKTN